MSELYFDDIPVGAVYGSDTYTVTADDIVAFGRLWDPQPFHTDPQAAENSFFGGLAASGWHTAAITMRLFATGQFTPKGGKIGAGIEKLKWVRPVRPGDVLSVRTEVLEKRPLASKPGIGLVTVRITTLDAAGEPVQSFTSPLVVPTRCP